MNMLLHRITLSLLLYLIPTSLLGGQLIVNEALVNEPGVQVALEWFELWNPGPSDASLDGYSILVNGAIITDLPAGELVLAGKYLVISRNLVRFESFWGDKSGVWGDNPSLENYDVIEASFQLTNTTGNIRAVSATDTSLLNWPSSGADGISWERRDLLDNTAKQSFQLFGTPGRINSRSRPARDWQIVGLAVTPLPTIGASITLKVFNPGDSSLPSSSVLFTLDPDPTGDSLGILAGDSLAGVSLPPLAPLTGTTLNVSLELPGFYNQIGMLIRGNDDKPENNFIIFTAPGVKFPAVIINEFLADPKDPQIVEWIELKNVSPDNLDLANWRLGDSKGTKFVGQSSKTILAGDYVILTENRLDFLTDYPSVSPLIVHEVPWSILNNDGDIVKLIDRNALRSDQFGYASGWGDNITWSRSEEPGMTDLWGRSAVTGGTPGDSNLTLLNPTGDALLIDILPNPFSPDGDLIDDTAFIRIDATMGDGMQARVFDRDGRLVRTLFDGRPFGGRLAWDGMTDAGRRAPIGIYIIYVEISGAGSAKKTVVIAR